MTNLKTANNPKAIIEMPWTLDECIVSVMNIEADGRAYVYPKNDKGRVVKREAVRYSYRTHLDDAIPNTSVIENLCGTEYCVNYLHLTAVPRELYNLRKRKEPKKFKAKFGTVSYDKSRSNWMARVTVDGKRKTLGRFATEEEARAAIEAARGEETR